MIPKQHLYTQLSYHRSLLFSCSVVSDSVTRWTTARQASLSFIISQSLLKLMSIESMMLSNHLILCWLGETRHLEWCMVSRLCLSHTLSQKAIEGCAQSKWKLKAIKRRKTILLPSLVIQRLKVCASKAEGPASIPDPACLN